MNTASATKGTKSHQFGFAKVVILLLGELLIIQALRHSFGFECHVERYGFCDLARNILLAGYSLAAALVILGLFARDAWRDLLTDAGLRAKPLALNVAGLAVLVASLPLLRLDLSIASQVAIYTVWAAFGFMALAGALLMIAPLERWHAFVKILGWRIPVVGFAGIAAPFIALQIRPFWDGEFLAGLTFKIVTWLLSLWGQPIEIDAENKIIGAGKFFIDIAPSCSGIEGLVLTTVFTSIFLLLFRSDLRFPHAFIILPIALLASWLLNSVRIAVLVQIGISGHPELAVGGFHSHAGWLMFTLLSLGIVLVSQSTGIFRARDTKPVETTASVPFFADPIVAQILPFIVFMASALLASTFSENPSALYPLRAVAMGMVLILIWPHIRSLVWRLDPVAIASGAFVAVYWVASGPTDATASPVAEVGSIAFLIWVVARVIGTSLLVPVIEELFFRGYLMDLIAPAGAHRWRVVLAVILTSVVFAALHDRWIAAAAAGVIFALLVVRSRNVTDAIVSHAVANALIAAWAVGTGNWAVI